ncbi:MAG: hypothetical protein JRG96_05450 [Deltaproteobacteria bacterium]|nr:hypothetical protein [Deltaproteobacteria bacterium]MBW2416948.1 hypothetical protein [Deltaproteobacteria bacterium]
MTTSIGTISIDWTKVEGSGDVDLSQVVIEMSSDVDGLGFDMSPLDPPGDGLTAHYPSLFDIKLEFTVSSSEQIGSVGNFLTDATGQLTADTTGGYFVHVFETLAQEASVTATVFHSPSFSDPATIESLAAPRNELDIVKNIIVNYTPGDTSGGDFARIDLLRQRFQAVPEPASGFLVLCGLLGVSLGSRPKRGARSGRSGRLRSR